MLSDEERQKAEQIREFARTEIVPIVNDYWARAEFPFDLIDGFRELDPLSWADPRSPVKPPSNLLAGFTAMELAHADPSIATFFGVHAGLAMGSISSLGSEEQRLRWLPQMSRFEKIGAFALTAPHGGSDVSGGLETTARRDGDTWILDGTERWIGNATFADLIVVWARDVETKHVLGFVVEKDMPGFRDEDREQGRAAAVCSAPRSGARDLTTRLWRRSQPPQARSVRALSAGYCLMSRVGDPEITKSL